MIGLLVLLLLAAAATATLWQRSSPRHRIGYVTALLAVIALSGCDARYEGSIDAPSTASSPCAAETPGPACDDAERARYLADLAKQQIRTTPVLVGWRDQLPWGRQTPITAIIASAERAAASAALDTATAKAGVHVEERPVAIGRRVRAELSGLEVEIDKPEQVRDVTALQNVTFTWLVKPTRPGRTTLTLRIFNELVTPEGPIELEHPALVHEMAVKIGLLDWLNWQMERTKGLVWVIGGLLTGLGVVFANRARLRRWWRRGHPPGSPPAPPAP